MLDQEVIRDRISDTRLDMDLTQKKLCELADITPTQLSRIESGVTETVSSDVLIKLAKTLNVSTDYILGLTNISSPKNYYVSELGLSEGAIRTIVSCKADIHALNAFLENAKTRELIRLMMAYFMDTISIGVMARNEMLDYATLSLNEFISENPDKKADVIHSMRDIKASKTGVNEVDIERLKTQFLAILRDIKSQIKDSTKVKPAVDTAMVKKILAEVEKKKPKSVKEVSRIVTNMVKKSAHLDDEHTELYQKTIEQIITAVGN